MYCTTCNTSGSSGFPTGSTGFQWDTNAKSGIRYCSNCQSVMDTYHR